MMSLEEGLTLTEKYEIIKLNFPHYLPTFGVKIADSESTSDVYVCTPYMY